MLKLVDVEDFKVKLMEEDMYNLVVGPPHLVLKIAKMVSLYSLKLDKWTFHCLKILILKCRALEGKIEE